MERKVVEVSPSILISALPGLCTTCLFIRIIPHPIGLMAAPCFGWASNICPLPFHTFHAFSALLGLSHVFLFVSSFLFWVNGSALLRMGQLYLPAAFSHLSLHLLFMGSTLAFYWHW